MNKTQWFAIAIMAAVVGSAQAVSPLASSDGTHTAALATSPTLPPGQSTNPTDYGGGADCTQVKDSDELVALSDRAGNTVKRGAALARMEQCARKGSVPAQDFVGSIYWMGDSLPHGLVATNLAKARLYFSNAAAHGDILDMAKLAELELSQGNSDAAMVWAQLFSHYAPLIPGYSTSKRGYLAELLIRINQHFNSAHLSTAMNDANSFAAQYDSAIRVYAARQNAITSKTDQFLRGQPSRSVDLPTTPADPFKLPHACLAEYLIAYNNDGSAYGAWMIDALPDARCGKSLRSLAIHARASPDTNTAPGVRLTIQLISWDDERYDVGPTAPAPK